MARKRVKVHLVSLTPLLRNPMLAETLEGLGGKGAPQLNKDRPASERAAELVQHNEKGKMAFSSSLLIAALCNAGRNVKNGKKQISTATSTTLFSFLWIENPWVTLTDGNGKSPEWVVDKRPGTNPQTGGAVCIIRPRVDHWEADIIIKYDDSRVHLDTVKKLFEDAGLNQGVGSGRPSRKMPFGQFEATKWEEITEAA